MGMFAIIYFVNAEGAKPHRQVDTSFWRNPCDVSDFFKEKNVYAKT
jgi:hypothetical protein